MQIYAVEYWADYFTTYVESNKGLSRQSYLYSLLHQLIRELDAFYKGQVPVHGSNENVKESKLEYRYLQEHPTIHDFVRKAIWARSMKSMERTLKMEVCKWWCYY